MFNADQKYTKETRGPKNMNYLLFICFLWGFFLLHSLRKSLSETCNVIIYITIVVFYIKGVKRGKLNNLNFLNFHPILMHFFFKVFIFMSYWWTIIFFNYLISERGLKRVSNSIFRKFERFIGLLFFFQFWRDFVVVELIVLRAFGSMSTDFLYLLRIPR